MMRESGWTVKVTEVLEHDTIDGFVKTIAEDKVNALQRGSFAELEKFFHRHKIFIADEADLPMLVEAIETRNISVHNRAVINKIYLQKVTTKTAAGRIGKRRLFSLARLEPLTFLLGDLVAETDESAVAKYGLEVVDVRQAVMDAMKVEPRLGDHPTAEPDAFEPQLAVTER